MSRPLGKSIVTFGLAFVAGVAGAALGWLGMGLAGRRLRDRISRRAPRLSPGNHGRKFN